MFTHIVRDVVRVFGLVLAAKARDFCPHDGVRGTSLASRTLALLVSHVHHLTAGMVVNAVDGSLVAGRVVARTLTASLLDTLVVRQVHHLGSLVVVAEHEFLCPGHSESRSQRTPRSLTLESVDKDHARGLVGRTHDWLLARHGIGALTRAANDPTQDVLEIHVAGELVLEAERALPAHGPVGGSSRAALGPLALLVDDVHHPGKDVGLASASLLARESLDGGDDGAIGDFAARHDDMCRVPLRLAITLYSRTFFFYF